MEDSIMYSRCNLYSVWTFAGTTLQCDVDHCGRGSATALKRNYVHWADHNQFTRTRAVRTCAWVWRYRFAVILLCGDGVRNGSEQSMALALLSLGKEKEVFLRDERMLVHSSVHHWCALVFSVAKIFKSLLLRRRQLMLCTGARRRSIFAATKSVGDRTLADHTSGSRPSKSFYLYVGRISRIRSFSVQSILALRKSDQT